jgi:hypothetical protein
LDRNGPKRAYSDPEMSQGSAPKILEMHPENCATPSEARYADLTQSAYSITKS